MNKNTTNKQDLLRIWLQSNDATKICTKMEGGDRYYVVVVPVRDYRNRIKWIFGKLYDIPIIGLEFWQQGVSYFNHREDAIKIACEFFGIKY